MERNSWQQAIRGREYFQALMQGVIICAMIAYLFYHSMWAMFLLAPFLVPYMRRWEHQKEAYLRAEFQIQFRDYLQTLAAALSAGYALENAMVQGRNDLVQQYDQGTRIMKDTQMMKHLLGMNMPAEQVWEEWANQVEIEEVSRFATVFMVAKKSGGDSIAIIKHAIRNICETLEVKAEIRVVLAGKRMEFQIMSVIPLGIIGYMKLCFGDFMSLLYGNIFGVLLMTICLGVYLGAILWGYKIIQIEV